MKNSASGLFGEPDGKQFRLLHALPFPLPFPSYLPLHGNLERVQWRWEWDSGNDHLRQRITLEIHTIPERIDAENNTFLHRNEIIAQMNDGLAWFLNQGKACF